MLVEEKEFRLPIRPMGQVLKESRAVEAGDRSPPRLAESALLYEGAECVGAPAESLLRLARLMLLVEGTEYVPALADNNNNFLEPTFGMKDQIPGLQPRARTVLPLGELPLGERALGSPDCTARSAALPEGSAQTEPTGHGTEGPVVGQPRGL